MTSSLSRRSLLGFAALAPLSGLLAACVGDTKGIEDQNIDAAANEDRFADSEFRRLSDAQWQARLEPLSYRVLRHEDTERAFTSALYEEHRAGIFSCAGCDLELFRSEWKYASGTGWPSFTEVMRTNIGTKSDMLIGYPRTEYHCARCLGHQGHVFPDGPPPTGLRYCNNGAALKFTPA